MNLKGVNRQSLKWCSERELFNSENDTNDHTVSRMLKGFGITKKELRSLPVIALVLVNLIPIVGVIWFGWDALVLVALYWVENLIVGFFVVLKIIFAPIRQVKIKNKLIGIPVFSFFWGWCNAAYGVVIIFFFVIFPQITGAEPSGARPLPEGDFFSVSWPGPLGLFELGIDAVIIMFYILPYTTLVPLCSLIASHGISFVSDYLIKGGRHSVQYQQTYVNPATRVLILHAAIMVGGFLSMILSPSVVILVFLVIFKCWIDAGLYIRQQRNSKNRRFGQNTFVQ